MAENFNKLPINELRQMWAEAWGIQPHERIGRTMLEKSLEYKVQEQNGHGLNHDQVARLNKLIQTYKQYPKRFDSSHANLKEGTKVTRIWKGKKHTIIVKNSGFEYQGQTYKSLSKIANDITGKNWNGWTFFELKKKAGSA